MNTYTAKKETRKKDILRYILPILILCYILFLVGKSSVTNLNINQEIYNLQSEIESIKDKNQALQELNKYYKSDSYKEKQARLKLGYAKPGESVIIIPSENKPQEDDVIIDESSLKTKTQIDQPNWKNWLNYFFQ